MNSTNNFTPTILTQPESGSVYASQFPDEVDLRGEELRALIRQYEAETGHKPSNALLSAMRGWIPPKTQPSRETYINMNDYPTPQGATLPLDPERAAYEAAVFAAAPGHQELPGHAFGLQTHIIATDSQHSPNAQPYNPTVAEAEVAVHRAALSGAPAPGFEDLLAAVSGETYTIPMSPEVRAYAKDAQDGDTMGAADRFSAIAAHVSLADLAALTVEARQAQNILQQWSVDICTARDRAVGASRASIQLPEEWA